MNKNRTILLLMIWILLVSGWIVRVNWRKDSLDAECRNLEIIGAEVVDFIDRSKKKTGLYPGSVEMPKWPDGTEKAKVLIYIPNDKHGLYTVTLSGQEVSIIYLSEHGQWQRLSSYADNQFKIEVESEYKRP